MKKIIIIFMIFLMIAGATVGVLKWLNIGPFGNESSELTAETSGIKEKVQLLDLDPLIIHLVQDDKVVSIIKMELKLKTRGTANLKEITRLKPKLKHAFFSDLHAFLPRMLNAINRLDQTVIRERLVIISQRMTKKKIVEDVLITSITDKEPRK